MDEWLEAEGESVEAAVQAALEALGLTSPEQVSVEVLREPKKGFLGLGSQMALVKVTQKPSRRRRRGRSSKGDAKGKSGEGARKSEKASTTGRSGKTNGGNGSERSRSNQKQSKGKGSPDGRPANSRSAKKREGSQERQTKPTTKPDSKSKRPSQEAAVTENKGQDNEPKASIEEQATVAVEFLEGLVESFGLDGEVTSRIDDEVLYLDIDGDTEALVGNRGVILHSVLELTRTVIQRKTYGAPRMRIDIAGYAARRREALQIYAGRLAEKVLADGGEVMLEPMNPADRKVVHDAIGEIDGVRSYSEGEDPNRSVVVAPE
jgi:spoIIIJ-associated protein